MFPFALNEGQMIVFLLVLIRVSSILLFLPIFGDKVIPSNIKVLMAFSVSGAVFSGLSAQINSHHWTNINDLSLIFAIIQEIALGVIVGFVSKWAFEVVQMAGQVAGVSMGFSMPTVLDPNSEAQVVPLSQIKYVLAALLFLALDGHLLYLGTITESFKGVPLGAVNLISHAEEMMKYFIGFSSEIISMGIRLAFPVIGVVLVVNLTFGLISKIVPQMNVFAVSFAANILIGLFITVLCLPVLMNVVSDTITSYLGELNKLLGMLHG